MKQERFYVVSETELQRLEMAAYTKAALNSMVNLPIGVKVPGTEDAEAACRSREVVPTTIQNDWEGDLNAWVEVEK